MNQLQVIENNGQRVLTTAQIAEAYGTTERRVSENFNANKDKYIEGKHFYFLTGDDLKSFLQYGNSVSQNPSKVRTLYLWTEKGAFLHAKSLGTDKAWEVYDMLIDTYFNAQQQKIETAGLSKELQMFQQMFISVANNEIKLNQLEANQAEQSKIITEQSKKLDNALEIFSNSTEVDWKKQINDKINRVCTENKLNYQMVRHDMYNELEIIAKCKLSVRVENLKKRLKQAGAKYIECQTVTKLDVISRDNKLKPIFEGIVQKFQSKYIA